MLTQLGDIHIHRAGIEVVIVYPDGLEGKVALQYLVGMTAEEREEFVLLRGKLCLLVIKGEELLLGVKGETTYLILCALLRLLAVHAAQDSLNTEHEFLHGERLCDIIVCTYLKSLQNVFLQLACREEDDRHIGIGLTYLRGQLEAILLRHHDIKHANIILCLEESTIACFAIGTEVRFITLCLEILSKQHSKVLVILAKEDLQVFI